jgi:hypothetical protein
MRTTLTTIILAAILAVVALTPASAQAPEQDTQDDGFILQVREDLVIPAGMIVGTVIVIDASVRIEGTVDGVLVVINGNADITGRVVDDTVMVRSDLVLRSTADVNDVTLADSNIDREDGSTVRGDIEERDRWGPRLGGLIFGFFFWLASTLVVLVAGVLFAAVGGGQLGRAATALTTEVGPAIVGGVVALIGIPILAVLLFLTLVGIPVGLALLLFLVPALLFLGYITFGTWLGLLILNRDNRPVPAHPYAAALLGLIILQLGLLIPGLGGLVAVIGAAWGAGGLLVVAWRAWRSRDVPPSTPREGGPSPA